MSATEGWENRDTTLSSTKQGGALAAIGGSLRGPRKGGGCAISALSNPDVCALYDVGRENGIDYLVMEYLDGQTRVDRLGRGPLPVEELLRTAVDLEPGLPTSRSTLLRS